MRARFTLLWTILIGACLARAQAPLKLSLHEAEQTALRANPQVSASRYTAQAALEVPKEYRAAYLPQVSGNITGAGALDGSRIAAGALNNPIIYDRLATGLTAGQMVTDFGRTGNLVQSARLNAQAQGQQFEATRADIILQVDRAYYALLRAQNVLTVAQQTVKDRQLIVDQVTALAESKLKSTLDVSFANVNLSEAKLLLAQAENDRKSADADLAAVLGLPKQQIFELAEEPMPEALPGDSQDLVNQALQSRPDLADLRFQASAASRFAQAEKALYYPTISAVATGGYLPAHQEELRNRYAAAGVNVSIPILNGGLFGARRAEALLKASAAEDKVRDLETRIARDVRVAYLDTLTAYQRMHLTAELVQQTKLALDLAQARYDIGLGSIVELSQAQLNQTSAQIANVSAGYEYQAQRAFLTYQEGLNR